MAAPSPRTDRLPVLLDIEGVATHLNITVRHVRRLVFERRIPHLKVGRLLRFDPDEIAAWLRATEVSELSRTMSERRRGE